MKHYSRKRVKPYSNVFTGVKQLEDVTLDLFKYNAKSFEEHKGLSLDQVSTSDKHFSYWINITGIHDEEKVKSLCEAFNVHPLIIEDILDVYQRTKFQEFDDYWFFSLKAINLHEHGMLKTEHLSFILGSDYLISFQEVKADHFEHIRERIRQGLGIVRERTPDYLLYLFLEAILDGYFHVLGEIEDAIAAINLTDKNADLSTDLLSKIELFKRQVNAIKRMVNPVKEFALTVEREKPNMIDKKHLKYYYEIKDIAFTLVDECDKLEMRLDSNINLFFSVQGNKMNEVMKTLTVMATIFIPLTFIAGIYGMNFTHMPELQWEHGYALVWLVMVLATLGMLYYFRRKRWF